MTYVGVVPGVCVKAVGPWASKTAATMARTADVLVFIVTCLPGGTRTTSRAALHCSKRRRDLQLSDTWIDE
jgi:hypothetical protein